MLTYEQLEDCTRIDEHIRRIDMSFNNAAELLEKLDDPDFKLHVNDRSNKQRYPFVLVKRSSRCVCEILINEVEYCEITRKLGENVKTELYKFR